MDKETEDRLMAFGVISAIVFVALLIVAVVLAITHWLFGGAGVALVLGLAVVALLIGGLFVWLMGDEL